MTAVRRPLLLDLCCGPGGAARGYHRAGFDVVGVDIKPQPHYPFQFIQADALTVLHTGMIATDFYLKHVQAIHASPPCQRRAAVTRWRGKAENHPDLLTPVLEELRGTSLPWVVENVPGAPFGHDLELCGSMFGLPIRRHRWFVTSWGDLALVPSCQHRPTDLPFMHKGERAYADAMGCEWMSKEEARQAIPPAYTEWIGRRLLEHMGLSDSQESDGPDLVATARVGPDPGA